MRSRKTPSSSAELLPHIADQAPAAKLVCLQAARGLGDVIAYALQRTHIRIAQQTREFLLPEKCVVVDNGEAEIRLARKIVIE